MGMRAFEQGHFAAWDAHHLGFVKQGLNGDSLDLTLLLPMSGKGRGGGEKRRRE
jgi:hypothetical protein